MSYLAARKWYCACMLAAVASLCAKFVAEDHAKEGMIILARAIADLHEGKIAAVPVDIKEQSAKHARWSDIYRLTSLVLLIGGVLSLGASAWKREPVRRAPAVVLLIAAGYFQLFVV